MLRLQGERRLNVGREKARRSGQMRTPLKSSFEEEEQMLSLQGV
jgi:hypothetical protein